MSTIVKINVNSDSSCLLNTIDTDYVNLTKSDKRGIFKGGGL